MEALLVWHPDGHERHHPLQVAVHRLPRTKDSLIRYEVRFSEVTGDGEAGSFKPRGAVQLDEGEGFYGAWATSHYLFVRTESGVSGRLHVYRWDIEQASAEEIFDEGERQPPEVIERGKAFYVLVSGNIHDMGVEPNIGNWFTDLYFWDGSKLHRKGRLPYSNRFLNLSEAGSP